MAVTSPRPSKNTSPFTASASAYSGTLSHWPTVSTPSGAPTFSWNTSAVRSTPRRGPPTGCSFPRSRSMNVFGSFA